MNARPAQPLLPEVGIIALVPDHWGPEWQSRHHIAVRLARYFRLVWVNRPPSWRAIFSQRHRHPSFQCSDRFDAPFEVYDPGLRLPMFGRPAWLERLCSRQRLIQAHSRLARHGCRKLVLYLWRPEFASALDCSRHDLSCYHIDDEYSFSAAEREIDTRELRLIQSVGQVFIQSPALMEKKGCINPHTEFIPNGADYNQYASPVPEPEDLKNIPRPRIGYGGVVKIQLDWPILFELSARRPHWSFIFVGATSPHPEMETIRRALSARPNVHFLGAKNAYEMSRYPRHFDVCMMPYRVDDYTKYIYPIKLHEFLASGQPCVGSPIYTLQGFDDVVLLARSAEDWCRAIERALSDEQNSSARRAARQRVAQAHDWDILVARIARTLATRLGLELPVASQQLDTCMPDPAMLANCTAR